MCREVKRVEKKGNNVEKRGEMVEIGTEKRLDEKAKELDQIGYQGGITKRYYSTV